MDAPIDRGEMSDRIFRFGPFRLEEAEKRLLRGNEPVALRPKVFDTLLVLVRNAGRLLPKEDLMASIWPGTIVEEGNLPHNVSVLRKALGSAKTDETYIETVPKRGYRFVAEVRVEEGSASGLLSGHSPEPGATRSIAVLPFADLSPAGDQEYFCEGMAEEILDALARIDGLRVASRMSSFQIRELASDPAAIGRRLDVDALIRGSVRKAGSRVRVTARLLRVSDGSILWSDRYDRELEDIFAIQEEIARGIVGTLRPWLGAAPARPLRSSRTDRVEAYEFYLKGRQFFLRDTRHDLESAREMFERAIAADPGYARAHAGLSDACALLYKHFDRDPALIREAERASGRAIELDTASADGHTSRGVVAWLTDRMEEAAEEFSEAIRLDPGYFEARYLFGMCFLTRGMLEEALEQFEAAWELRPDDFQSPILMATMHRELGRPEEARTQFRRGLELADEHLELDPENVRAQYLGAFSLVQLGREEEGIARVRRAVEQAPNDSMTLYNAAGVHALAGRTDAALDYLERALDSGFAYHPDLVHDTDFASIRPHPRFQALLDRLDPSG